MITSKVLAVSFALGLVGCGNRCPSTTPASPPDCAAAHPGMRSYTMALLYRGPAWTPDPSPAGEGHMAHIREMAAKGQLHLAGPFEQPPTARDALAGIFILNASSLAEARALVDGDPAVRAGRLRAELLEWYGPKSLVCALSGAP